jgi:uncharacterized protein YbjT (DUF2867 family)
MILVTGATGFIGRSLMRVLQLSDKPAKAYSGRINDPISLRLELLDVQTIIHLAGAETRGRERHLHHIDVEGTERLVEESRRMAVRHLIVISRLGADPNSSYPLLQAKGEVERIIRRSGIPYTLIRSATVYGRDDRFLNTIASLAAWSWPFVWLPAGGHVPMQPLWVEDLARCLVAAVDRPDLHNKTVDLAGPELLRYRDIVKELLLATGMRRWPLRPPLLLVRPFASLFFGWRSRPPVSRLFLHRFTTPDVAAADSVLRQFGFKPGRLSEHIAYLRRPWWRWRLFRA